MQVMTLRYMSGIGNEFETEALPGALPRGQNSPQRCPYGLYAEQLSGTAFTAPRAVNARSWLYRILPTVRHAGRFRRVDVPNWKSPPNIVDHGVPLGPLRWDPVPSPAGATNFVSGIRTLTTAGDVATQAGMAAHAYSVNETMRDEYFMYADGELLVVPERGRLLFATELGRLEVGPGEIAVLPRGLKYRVELPDGPARGYACENFGIRFALPELGPIGANGSANPRDFLSPVAAFEDREAPSRLTVKWGGAFHACDIPRSPLDVVAWHGNYAPYKYDLRRFCPMGPILFDHADPSIFTVLTSPSGEPGTANVDFVIFPERWMVAEHTFRPPWYHSNVMSEFMGLIYGRYDAKEEGFVPGGFSLHNCMLPHGPDNDAFEKASHADLKPAKLSGTLAFMFETRLPQHLTEYAAKLPTRQEKYADCWSGLKKLFDGTPDPK
jgi:homogentisate 1,2-dioxygenase